MKKIISLAICTIIAFTFTICMTGCGNTQEALPEEDVDYEIALITNEGLIMDGGHNEVSWNTITEFGSANGISHKYYKATESTEGAFVEAIEQAISKRAKLVIVDNSLMEDAVYKMQEKYPEIKFVLINANPYKEETGDVKVASNTVAITFDSAQAGYLAGYAAVVEGYTSMGFIGEEESDEIKGFGYGFVQGANRGAQDQGTMENIKYVYSADSQDHDAVYNTAIEMYESGVEVIFAAGNSIQDAVIEAAEAKDGKVIGSNTDRSKKSDKVITSAIYNINAALEYVLKAYQDDKFPGGEINHYNATNKGIGLELKNNNLNVLTQKEYDAIYEELANGDIKFNIKKQDSVKDLKTPNVTIE